jgi:hypothetical protein
MGNVIKSPWDQKPGIVEKLEIDESGDMFDDWDADGVIFDDINRENDMVFDYKAARTNAHFCVHASKKILNMIAHNLQYERNPDIADACVRLVKVIAENNRDLIKIHKDFKTTSLIGKPKAGGIDGASEEEEDGTRQDKVKTTVSEVVAAAKAAKDEDNAKS